MQLVLQCYSRMEAVLHILPHTFKPVLQQISMLQAWNKIIYFCNFFSFPGGKKDPEDSTLIETAIREMDEELGLDRRHVEVWAPMPTMPDRVRHCLSKIS